MKIAIIGLPQSGKTTLFKALSSDDAPLNIDRENNKGHKNF